MTGRKAGAAKSTVRCGSDSLKFRIKIVLAMVLSLIMLVGCSAKQDLLYNTPDGDYKVVLDTDGKYSLYDIHDVPTVYYGDTVILDIVFLSVENQSSYETTLTEDCPSTGTVTFNKQNATLYYGNGEDSAYGYVCVKTHNEDLGILVTVYNEEGVNAIDKIRVKKNYTLLKNIAYWVSLWFS